MRYVSSMILLLVACSSGQRPADSANDEASGDEWKGAENIQQETVTEVPTCVDENNEPIQCEDNSECCEGFECGYDPEGSERIKTCLWTGKK
ncbi:MAG: hypothetical protein JW751_24990 [Polyangiaceae bacterium]|nr:hypothetical protein [Polyangiaceae bacterium]